MWYLVIIISVMILLAISSQPFFAEKRLYSYRAKLYIMTQSEAILYRKLLSLYGSSCIIIPQVRLSSFLDEKVKGQNWRSALSHINQKSVDFLFLDKDTFSVKFAIELDDYTHNSQERKFRDSEVNRIFKSASIPLIRLKNTNYKNIAQIKKDIDKQFQTLYT